MAESGGGQQQHPGPQRSLSLSARAAHTGERPSLCCSSSRSLYLSGGSFFRQIPDCFGPGEIESGIEKSRPPSTQIAGTHEGHTKCDGGWRAGTFSDADTFWEQKGKWHLDDQFLGCLETLLFLCVLFRLHSLFFRRLTNLWLYSNLIFQFFFSIGQ